MSNYTPSTDFAAKDSLLSGNPLKVVKGVDFAVEFTAIQSAIASKYDSGSVVPISAGGTGSITAASALVSLGATTSTTGSAIIPSGTTAQRDTTPSPGFLRYNITTTSFEGYNGSVWGSIGGGATGGGSDTVFQLNNTVMTTNYTIPSGKNAMMVGPLSVATGVTLSVPSGSRLVIL